MSCVGNCKHEFHHDCLKKWTASKRTCPTCRGPAKFMAYGYWSGELQAFIETDMHWLEDEDVDDDHEKWTVIQEYWLELDPELAAFRKKRREFYLRKMLFE
ncbi:MAG: hypothetical protein MMC33_006898 [Icmadophila ericetorum]|nr:hypothetical protein [Icmadophila ericetorum]